MGNCGTEIEDVVAWLLVEVCVVQMGINSDSDNCHTATGAMMMTVDRLVAKEIWYVGNGSFLKSRRWRWVSES